jgi:putative DNA primase/helicase
MRDKIGSGWKRNSANDDLVLPPEFSEDRLALQFAERHANDRRYVAAWGRWLSWNATHWSFDETLHAFDLARAICRESASVAGTKAPKVAAAISSAKTVAATITLARADRRIAATTDQWDSDPWAFNTPELVVDLRTGDARAHQPTDYMTKLAGASPDSSCPIPIWTEFLDRITGGDADLQSFIQRMAGYCLTGITREHALFFCYGTGANGKSVFLRTIAACMGDYAKMAPIETFTASHGDRHPTELAGLRGARLVTAVETEEGRRWAESRIKALTGGDAISARFMKQDFFEFIPQFKLMIAGYHRPGLRSVDEAIRRRFNLLPFTVTIPADERDQELPEKLRDEYPGILAWMIDGCLQWQERGLLAPEAVTAATAAYLDAEDAFQAWLDEAVIRDQNAWTQSSLLFANWKEWAERTGEHVGSMKRMVQTLETRGFVLHKRKNGNGFLGIALPASEQPYWADNR